MSFYRHVPDTSAETSGLLETVEIKPLYTSLGEKHIRIPDEMFPRNTLSNSPQSSFLYDQSNQHLVIQGVVLSINILTLNVL